MSSFSEIFGQDSAQSCVTLGRNSLLDAVNKHECSTPSSALYIRPGEIEALLSSCSSDQSPWREALSLIGEPASNSNTGLVCLRSGDRGFVVIPPFPVIENKFYDCWNSKELENLLSSDYLIGVILLRLGRFSVALFQGDKLINSKTDARYVKGRHRKGGSSQRRFERIREGQVRRLYDKTCDAVRVILGEYDNQIDYVVLGGEGITINNFLKICPRMAVFTSRIIPERLNIRDPKRDTLDHVSHLVWQSKVYAVKFD